MPRFFQRLKRGDMRWFRFGSSKRDEQDPGRQQQIYRELRQRYAPVPGQHNEARAAEAVQLFDGDDGIVVATVVIREYADSVHAALAAQGFQVERRDYRWSWQGAGPRLRSPLVAGTASGLDPFVQVAAAVTVLGAHAKQAVKIVNPVPTLEHVLEILDMVTSGWEYGGVLADVDAANLAAGLISAATAIRAAMSDEPPLPSPIREQMRRNNTVQVWDPISNRVVGGFNPGREMREALLA